MEMKDGLHNSEFQNGLDVIETLKFDTPDEKMRNKIGEAKQIRFCTSTLLTPNDKGDCTEKKEVNPQESKIKIEPKDEIEDGEFQNGLRVIENLKSGVQTKLKIEDIFTNFCLTEKLKINCNI